MAKRSQDLEKRLVDSRRHLQTIAVLFCLLCAQLVSGEEKPKRTSLFDQQWLKALVSIEVAEPNKVARSIGSGFLVATPGKHLALVTAKHVAFDPEKGWVLRPCLAYRLNQKEGPSDLFTETDVAKYTPAGWFKSAKYDVACRLMVSRGKRSDVKTISYSLFLTTPQIEPGAPLFIIGFPMGMRSQKYATPVLRRGIIAWTDSDKIIAEASVFPGNSGGPVVYAQGSAILTSSVLRGQWLVGLVSECVSYVDVAISPQTGHPRITFEENSGLCNVVPASAILELLKSQEFVAVDMKGADSQSEQQADPNKAGG
jgi:hypothetical protein